MLTVDSAQAVHRAAKAKRETVEARDDALQARFREICDRVDSAAAHLRDVAARHAAGDASDDELTKARQAYTETQAADVAFQLECEGVQAALKAAEAAEQSAERAIGLAAVHAAEKYVHELEMRARKVAGVLRKELIDYRALVRYVNGCVKPNEVVPCTQTGEPRFQVALRAEIFDPASPEEIKVYSARDFVD